MTVIVVTGTPGCGKTKVAKEIARKRKLKYIDVRGLIKKNKLYDSYDKRLKTYVVDVKKLKKFLVKMIKESREGLVIDSHLGHYLDRKYVDLCVVVKCDLKILKKRLEKRGYNKLKVRENLDSEILDICLVEATEKGHNINVVDTTNGFK